MGTRDVSEWSAARCSNGPSIAATNSPAPPFRAVSFCQYRFFEERHRIASARMQMLQKLCFARRTVVTHDRIILWDL
jgi:hypothetical protein